ncbi:diguanylate cyclase [Sphingomonas lycopersici]|uniref:diguanylate cyclase n=1 Tax=Sphingomonas lycopersici TaxID=2951807 RepID=A0AA41ZBQ1_9SPHN|nr:GGDEF domain-containing protein [Sphingomonas lycopersici]
MGVIGTQRILESEPSPGLFERIGRFLAEQRLSPEPAHYTFAYHVMSDPEGPLARAVETLTDGGVRLSRKDIVSLGGEAVAGPTVELVAPAPARNTAPEEEQPNPAALIDRAKEHVDDFADTVRAIHVETRGFGRDIAASAAAIRRQGAVEGMDEIARLTGAMLDRVRQAEARLEAATRETEALRSALDEARDSARHDPLTELANRRAFDEAYAALVPGTAVVVAVCDIDYFKRINDRFGHAVGDRVLKAISQTLVAECEGHLVARVGGEEFAILFVGIALEEACAIVERARAAIAARRLRLRATDAFIGAITISAGLTCATGAEQQEEALARADAALYAAKHAGRNRVDIAP